MDKTIRELKEKAWEGVAEYINLNDGHYIAIVELNICSGYNLVTKYNNDNLDKYFAVSIIHNRNNEKKVPIIEYFTTDLSRAELDRAIDILMSVFAVKIFNQTFFNKEMFFK